MCLKDFIMTCEKFFKNQQILYGQKSAKKENTFNHLRVYSF